MTILNVHIEQVGLVGVTPNIIFIDTNNTIAEVVATGFLNSLPPQGYAIAESMMALVTTRVTPSSKSIQVGWFEIAKSGDDWSLESTGSPGSVTLPTIANHIATFTNTTGNLSEDPATAISGGNIQAGLSGTAGYLASFPATAARGSMRFVAANSVGDTVTTITNASMAAARTYTIPDGGQSASSFLLTDSAGTQTIATGSLALTLGNLTVAAGNIAATLGSVTAGTTVTAGTGITATTGNIVASAGNINATLGSMSAGTTMTAGTGVTATTGDITASAGNLVATLGNITASAGNIAATLGSVSAGTTVTAGTGITATTGNITASAGNMIAGANGAAGTLTSFPATAANGSLILAAVDAGGAFNTTISNGTMAQSTVYTVGDIGAATGAIPVSTGAIRMKMVADAAVAGGSATQNVADAFCTAASVVLAFWQTQANPAVIRTIVPGAGSFDIISDVDAGAGTVNYVIMK